MLYNYDIYGRFTAFSQKKRRDAVKIVPENCKLGDVLIEKKEYTYFSSGYFGTGNSKCNGSFKKWLDYNGPKNQTF